MASVEAREVPTSSRWSEASSGTRRSGTCFATLSTTAWATISDCLGLRGRLGKRVTLHDLRHTFATVFLARGGNIKDLQAILGHSSAMMTLDVYASSDLASRSRTMSMVGRDLGAVMPEASIAPLSEIFEFDRA